MMEKKASCWQAQDKDNKKKRCSVSCPFFGCSRKGSPGLMSKNIQHVFGDRGVFLFPIHSPL